MKHRQLAAIIVATSIASAAACAGSTSTAAPTAADAKALLDTVDVTFTKLSLDANRAGWIGQKSREMDASAILDDFAPLQKWLEEQTKGQPVGW